MSESARKLAPYAITSGEQHRSPETIPPEDRPRQKRSLRPGPSGHVGPTNRIR